MRCASWRTPTTWSSAPRPRSPAGPVRASGSATRWSPAARPASTAWHPDECRDRPRGRAGRVRAHRRRRHGRLPAPARRHPGVRRAAAPPARRRGPPPPSRHRDHRQLPRHLRAAATSTRPTTSPSARRSSTPSATPATGGSSPSSSSRTSLEPWGGVRAVWAVGSPRRRRTPSTPPTPSTPGWSRSRRTGLHRRPRLGELGPARVPRGLRPRHRPAARGRLRRAVRGVPDGLGRLTPLVELARVAVQHAELVALGVGQHGEALLAGLTHVGRAWRRGRAAGRPRPRRRRRSGRRSRCSRSFSPLAAPVDPAAARSSGRARRRRVRRAGRACRPRRRPSCSLDPSASIRPWPAVARVLDVAASRSARRSCG